MRVSSARIAVLTLLVAFSAWTTVQVEAIERLSDHTLVVALAVDREGVSLVGFSSKDRPFEARAAGEGGGPVQLEIALLGPEGKRHTQRIDVYGLCLQHPPATEAHIEGDTIRLHHETLIVEVPEIAGFDRLEAAWFEGEAGLSSRFPLGTVDLSADGASPQLTPGAVHWPEEYGDADRYLVFGDTAELDRRINVVLVPDGYTYAEKGTLLAHANSLVSHFRGKTPYREHDPFLNYILVFAYSTEGGTDQCDCSIVRDTAMNTRFLLENPTCGHTDNRCLFYGSGCDPNGSTVNIAAAELRAPARDVTLVMVNTTRYGGCGGSRAVYSAGNGAATEIAVHELGHTLAGLADEYAYTSGCGSFAGEVNTSSNGVSGAWPEWAPDLGAPVEGAQYYMSCLFRPAANCDMRALGLPFCPVCNQRWALRFFGHFRVGPSAPIDSIAPTSPVTTQVGLPIAFTADTRLGILGATNSFSWQLQGPGIPGPVVVGTSGSVHMRAFPALGAYTLTLEVVADTNFVKKERYGANRDLVSWTIQTIPVPEVSDDALHAMTASRSAAGPTMVELRFEDTGATAYNLYVSRDPTTTPFHVAAAPDGKRLCGLPVVTAGAGMLEAADVDLDAGITGDTTLLFFLVRADNGPGVEGPLGEERTADAACSP